MDDPRGGVRGVIPGKQKYAALAAARTDKPLASPRAFVHGDDLHFEHTPREALLIADHVDIVSAFLKTSGVNRAEFGLLVRRIHKRVMKWPARLRPA